MLKRSKEIQGFELHFICVISRFTVDHSGKHCVTEHSFFKDEGNGHIIIVRSFNCYISLDSRKSSAIKGIDDDGR